MKCQHLDIKCPNREEQKGKDYGKCLLRNPWACPLGMKENTNE